MAATQSFQHTQKLLDIHRRNLDHLNQQRAKFGELAVPLSLINEIYEQEAAIKRLENLLDHSSAAPGITSAPPPEHFLPQKAYDHFSGRHKELEQIIAALNRADQFRLIGLYGLGGIGKTALAREAAGHCLRQGQFQYVVWVSAKTEKFEGVAPEQLFNPELTFEGLLDEIVRQCQLPELREQSPLEKMQNIQALFATRPGLIVLDNMETVLDYESLVSRAGELLRGQSKLLLTSRHEVQKSNVYGLRLGGLSLEESLIFLREEGRYRGVAGLEEAPDEVLSEIHEVTGGAPLAMKLVVGQLSRQPLEPVLRSLRTASAQGQDYEFYRFIFQHSWNLLSLDARKILVSMSVFDPGSGGTVQMVLQVSEIQEKTFYLAMDDLIAMSLVDFGGVLGQRRYTLHQLTHHFILSDIVKQWE